MADKFFKGHAQRKIQKGVEEGRIEAIQPKNKIRPNSSN